MKRCFALALCAVFSVFGENLVFNSSFELGEKGWNGFCENKFTQEFTIKYPGKLWQVDSSTAHSGRNSLKISRKDTTERTVVLSHDIPVKFGKTYTVSFYAKSDEKTRCPVLMRAILVPPNRAPDGSIIPPTTASGKNALHVKNERIYPKNVDLTTGPEWKRYSFTFTPCKDSVAYTFIIDFQKKNRTLWIDDVQVEENARPTPYRPATPVEIALYLPKRTVGVQKAEGKAVAVSYGSDNRNYIDWKLKYNHFDILKYAVC